MSRRGIDSPGSPLQDVERLGARERSLLEACYGRYYDPLVRGLRQRFGGSTGDAEDIAQLAFEKLAVSLKRMEIRNPEAFVWRVAQNLALRLRRHEGVRDRHLRAAAQSEESSQLGATPERTVATLEELERVRMAVATLGERRREIFLLRRVDGLNYTQISERLGISRTAVTKHLQKAIAEIDRYLAER